MQLTKAEEHVMQILWEMGEGVVTDIRNTFSDPKPARNTVSTVLRILERKGYIEHKTFSNVHLYYPIISKSEYLKSQLFGLMERYFDNSLLSVVSFLAHEKDLSLKELEKLFKDIRTGYKKIRE
jgi:predicted transcriptional regulator